MMSKYHPILDANQSRERPDTIRCVVASLVADNESGDSLIGDLVDENGTVQPLQQAQVDDYSDLNWEPEPQDAGPGMCYALLTLPSLISHC